MGEGAAVRDAEAAQAHQPAHDHPQRAVPGRHGDVRFVVVVFVLSLIHTGIARAARSWKSISSIVNKTRESSK